MNQREPHNDDNCSAIIKQERSWNSGTLHVIVFPEKTRTFTWRWNFRLAIRYKTQLPEKRHSWLSAFQPNRTLNATLRHWLQSFIQKHWANAISLMITINKEKRHLKYSLKSESILAFCKFSTKKTHKTNQTKRTNKKVKRNKALKSEIAKSKH